MKKWMNQRKNKWTNHQFIGWCVGLTIFGADKFWYLVPRPPLPFAYCIPMWLPAMAVTEQRLEDQRLVWN